MGKRLLRFFLYAIAAWLILTIGCVLLLRWVNPLSSAFILRDRVAATLQGDKQFVFRQQWVSLQNIAPPVQLAVIASEDQKFPDHWGFDLQSIGDALDAREHGGRVRGASTISQQVAKNLFLWPGQSWLRKGIEAYFTALIETCWPKRRILEIYLNIAEFGRGVYGVEAASRNYLGKTASKLTIADAALLAAVLPNPVRLRVSAPSSYVRARQAWIIGQMGGLGGTTYLRNLN